MQKLNAKKNTVRALAIVIPAIILGTFYLQGQIIPTVLSVLFAWILAWLFAQYIEMDNRPLYSAIVIVVFSYCLSIERTSLAQLQFGQPLLGNLYHIFTASSFFVVMTVGLLIPSWLIFFGLDHFLCKAIKSRLIKV